MALPTQEINAWEAWSTSDQLVWWEWINMPLDWQLNDVIRVMIWVGQHSRTQLHTNDTLVLGKISAVFRSSTRVLIKCQIRLAYQWSIQKQSHSHQRSHTEGQDEWPPPAPSQSAAVAGWTNQRGEYETKDWTEEPCQAVVLLWKTCAQRQIRMSGGRCIKRQPWRFYWVPPGGARHTEKRFSVFICCQFIKNM